MRIAQFHEHYSQLAGDILDSPFEEVNQRTGVRIKMIPGGASFKIDLTDQRVAVTGTRKLFPHISAAECAWYLSGEKHADIMRRHNVRIWEKFTEPDGTVQGAYGYRFVHAFGRDQIVLAAEALRRNPTDRRIWVQAWDPREDGLGAEGQKNVPCPVGFTFSVAEDVLHSALFIRSSDVALGLPYDVMTHSMLMAAVAASIGCMAVGTMHVTLAHPHIYEPQFEMVEDSLSQKVHPEGPQLLSWDLDRVRSDPDGFVFANRKMAQEVSWPSFNPKTEVVV